MFDRTEHSFINRRKDNGWRHPSLKGSVSFSPPYLLYAPLKPLPLPDRLFWSPLTDFCFLPCCRHEAGTVWWTRKKTAPRQVYRKLLLLWNHHSCRCEFAYTNSLKKVAATYLYTIWRECWSVPDVVHKLAHFIAPLRPPQVKNRWLNAWQNPKWKENQCHLQSGVLEQQPMAFAVHKKIPLWWFNSR